MLLAAGVTATAVMVVGTVAGRLQPLGRMLLQVLVAAGGVATALVLGFGAGVLGEVPQAVQRGWAFIQSASAPVGPHPGVTIMVVGSVALLALAAQELAVPGRPALGVLPLVALYLVPSVVLVTPMLIWEFLLLSVSIVAAAWPGTGGWRNCQATPMARVTDAASPSAMGQCRRRTWRRLPAAGGGVAPVRGWIGVAAGGAARAAARMRASSSGGGSA